MKVICQLTIALLISWNSCAQIGAKAQQGNLTGVWQNNDFGYQMTLILQPNNTGEFDGETIKYLIKETTLSITQNNETNTYTYVLKGNSLTLSGGDLEKPILFTRQGSTSSGNSSKAVSTSPGTQSGTSKSAGIVGFWTGNNESIEFRSNGECLYQEQTYPYTLVEDHVVLQTSEGNLMMSYKVEGNQLTLGVGGQTLIYTRGKSDAQRTQNVSAKGAGNVARELVGKWCYVNVTSSNSGGSSSEQCITLYENGTYEYYGETSRSVNGLTYSGGTSSQGSDRGTWTYNGSRIFYQSQTGQGSGSYALEKRNHPKTNDPMIVLDGTTYVTFYQKAPW